MFHRNEKILSVHLDEIKGVAHSIEPKKETRPLCQQPYRAGPQSRELIEDHLNKMLAAKDIEQTKSDWASQIVIAPKKDGNHRFFVGYRKLN